MCKYTLREREGPLEKIMLILNNITLCIIPTSGYTFEYSSFSVTGHKWKETCALGLLKVL